MKMRRYVARDLRTALRQVRETQGSEAVIVSTRRLGDEVEVVAAIDYDAEPAAAPPRTVAAPEAVPLPVSPVTAEPAVAPPEPGTAEELRALRRMLESQLAALAWNDYTRRAPLRTALLKELAEIGLAHDTAEEVAAAIPESGELAGARRIAFARLAERLPIAADRWLETGGIVAFAGPSGAGKTTMLAKLAARWVMRHGSRDLVLVSCDGVRVGAHEQLRILGRLLDAAVHALDDCADLRAALPQLESRRLVLIDTEGSGPTDSRLPALLAELAASVPRFETALVLAATTQAARLEETVRRFAGVAAACLLTRLDEAASLGGALSVLIRSGLPLAYVSEGRRVPEDLRPARALELVARAVELARSSHATADEDLLARRFAGGARA